MHGTPLSYVADVDALSSLALGVVLTAVFLYALYLVVRRAVAAGRLDRQDRAAAVPPAEQRSR